MVLLTIITISCNLQRNPVNQRKSHQDPEMAFIIFLKQGSSLYRTHGRVSGRATDGTTVRFQIGQRRFNRYQLGLDTESTDETGTLRPSTLRTAEPLDQSTLSTMPETAVVTFSGRLLASLKSNEIE